MENEKYSSFAEMFLDKGFRAKKLICINMGIIELGSTITVCDPTLNLAPGSAVDIDIRPGKYYAALLIKNDSDYCCAGQIITNIAWFDDALDAFLGTWEQPEKVQLRNRCCIIDKTIDKNSDFLSEYNDVTAGRFGGLLTSKKGFVCVAGHGDTCCHKVHIVKTCREINGLVIDFNVTDLNWYMLENADNDGEYFNKDDHFHIFSLHEEVR
jgi:hypothetical protein